MSKKAKILTALVSVIVLLAGISITVFSVAGGKKPAVQSGNFANTIADRIEITVENTEFVLKKSSDKAESFTLTMFISAKKTQPDFYAVLDSIELTSLAYDNIVYTAKSEAAENKTVNSLPLTSTNGEADIFSWQTDITLSVLGKGVYNSVLKISYTSGITKNTAQSKFMEIPIKITVE